MTEDLEKIKPLLNSNSLEFREQGCELLLSLPPELQQTFFSGVTLNTVGQVTGGEHLPWSSSLLNTFLTLHPRRDDIVSLDISELVQRSFHTVWNDLSFPATPNLRHLSIGNQRVPYGEIDCWPKKLSLLRCSPGNLSDMDDEEHSWSGSTEEKPNLFQLVKSLPQLILHWYEDYEVIAWLETYQSGYDLMIFNIIEPCYDQGILRSFKTYYFTEDDFETPELGWAEVVYDDDIITVYDRGEGEDWPPSEDEPTTNKRTYDGEEWCDEYYERESFEPSKLIHLPTDLSLPDNPFFSGFLHQAIYPCGYATSFFTTPRSQFYHGTDRDPTFWLASMGTPVPGTNVGFDLPHDWQQRAKTLHVPTQWKHPTFRDGEFNKFTLFGDPKDFLPQAILGFDELARKAWVHIRDLDFGELSGDTQQLAAAIHLECLDNTIDYTLHKETLNNAIYTNCANIGLLIEDISLVETPLGLRIRVDAVGVASLFEYDPLFRRESHWSEESECGYIFLWTIFDHTHNLFRNYNSLFAGNLNKGIETHQQKFEEALQRLQPEV